MSDAWHYRPANFNLNTYILAYTGKCEKYVFLYEKNKFVKDWKIKYDDFKYNDLNSLLQKKIIF